MMDSEPTTTAGEWNPGFKMDSTREMSAQCYQQAKEKRQQIKCWESLGGKEAESMGSMDGDSFLVEFSTTDTKTP